MKAIEQEISQINESVLYREQRLGQLKSAGDYQACGELSEEI